MFNLSVVSHPNQTKSTSICFQTPFLIFNRARYGHTCGKQIKMQDKIYITFPSKAGHKINISSIHKARGKLNCIKLVCNIITFPHSFKNTAELNTCLNNTNEYFCMHQWLDFQWVTSSLTLHSNDTISDYT